MHDPSGFDRWLFTILGHVYLRWRERHGRERSRLHGDSDVLTGDGVGTREPDGFDVEVELERRELAELLDRALAALPAQTRDVLVQRFVDERPIREVADRLGLTQGMVQMRVQRGKLALRKVLTTDYADDALAFGLIDDDEAGWQQTPIWCPICGAARWQGRLSGPTRQIDLHCPRCREWWVRDTDTIRYGVKGFRPTLKRLQAHAYDFWRDWFRGQDVHPHRINLHRLSTHHLLAECRTCGLDRAQTLDAQALFTPDGRRFWQEHPRIRRVAYETIEAGGVPAVLTSYQSVTGAARLDVVLTRDTFQIVRSHRS